ncbi:MAG: Inositol 2-dehydrogenase [Firmicutes bacterium ADurb.Bin300]|nr:MAG: Inositol 2-dehydrogenase [Firmicutes bacterium ADurb.Bin300]
MANGALCVIDNSRKAAYGYDQRAEVFGSLGMVATSNDTLSTAVVSDENGVTGEKPLYFFLERYMQSFSQEMVDFVSAIENNTPVPVGIEAGLESVKIALAAKKSVLLHRPVKLSEIEG